MVRRRDVVQESLPEARRHTRHTLTLKVAYRDRQDYLGDWTENISAAGLFVRTEATISVGEHIDLELSFPGLLGTTHIGGTVAWRRPARADAAAGIGVRVDDAASRQRLAELALWAADSTPLTHGAELSVLVAEDNPLAVRFYQRALNHLGARSGQALEVTVTSDGHQALAHLAEHRVDLLITDLYMPLVDGLKLIEGVRGGTLQPDLPILVISSGGDEERALCAEAGVEAFLAKPVQIGALLSTILCLQRARTASRVSAAL